MSEETMEKVFDASTLTWTELVLAIVIIGRGPDGI